MYETVIAMSATGDMLDDLDSKVCELGKELDRQNKINDKLAKDNIWAVEKLNNMQNVVEAAEKYAFFSVNADDEKTYMKQYNDRKQLYTELKEAINNLRESRES